MVDDNFNSPDVLSGHKKIPKQYKQCELYIVAGEDENYMPRNNQLLFIDEIKDNKVFVRTIDCFISFGTKKNFIKNWETE